jgi:hypothetical protein
MKRARSKPVRSLGPSNDDSPAVRLEMLAAIHLGVLRHLPDVWDAGDGVAEFEASERIPNAWAWDISRPLAEQLAETAADDAAADLLENQRSAHTAALVADLDAKGPAYGAINDAFDAEDEALVGNAASEGIACTCGHAVEEHGNDPEFPGSTGCSECDCIAYESDGAS